MLCEAAADSKKAAPVQACQTDGAQHLPRGRSCACVEVGLIPAAVVLLLA
jgi:hypothetical protein